MDAAEITVVAALLGRAERAGDDDQAPRDTQLGEFFTPDRVQHATDPRGVQALLVTSERSSFRAFFFAFTRRKAPPALGRL